ncbi:MAG: KEOPS complex subunit Pcc1 [Candidatus Hydrothermarchaeota archaeon]
MDDKKTSLTVFRAVSPENKETPEEVMIKSWIEDDVFFTEMESKNLQKLISTLDDLLGAIILSKRCISAVE